jgi:hypothetical protein
LYTKGSYVLGTTKKSDLFSFIFSGYRHTRAYFYRAIIQ